MKKLIIEWLKETREFFHWLHTTRLVDVIHKNEDKA